MAADPMRNTLLLAAAVAAAPATPAPAPAPAGGPSAERVLTTAPAGHLLHNSQVFSPDDRLLVCDRRNDETRLAACREVVAVEAATGAERTVYRLEPGGAHGPGVGAATCSPVAPRVAFIRGLDSASPAEPYAPDRRCGMLAGLAGEGGAMHLDGRDVTPPFTPGALRGGSHAHHWSGDGQWISFTYNDAVVRPPGTGAPPDDLRTVGVMAPLQAVGVADARPGDEFGGAWFSVLVAVVTPDPRPGSDELSRACEEGWVGANGYLRPDGSRQHRALAFLGDVRTAGGARLTEVFLADLPDDLTRAGPAGPLAGTTTRLPAPPAGVAVRRLTRTETRRHPGVQGPRHWVRASPDGETIAFLARDEAGIVQLFGVSPNGGPARQLSRLNASVETPFTWSPDGRSIACAAAGRIQLVEVATGAARPLTDPSPPGCQPVHAVVFSHRGDLIAFNRRLPHPGGGHWLQVCLVEPGR